MELVPKYDDTVERKFHSRAATKKIVFEIDPRFLSQEDRVAGTALTQALDLGKRSRGEKVELTISAGRPRNNHLSDFIDKTANALKTKAGQKPDGVTKLKVGVLENLDSRMEVLDLIAQRLVHQFDDIPVGADLRFPQVERYKALKRAYNAWKNVLGNENDISGADFSVYFIFGGCFLWWRLGMVLPAGDAILSSSLTLGAIITGFLATAKAIVMTLDSPIMKKIRQTDYSNDLVSYLGQAIWLSFSFCILSIVGFLCQRRMRGLVWFGFLLVWPARAPSFA
ncbi:hypothetical protein HML84_12640 [Alcanivorax sp. IO_7]|nr:hypothetical protein HML84_12640 [Alcanivorax sp. IO_7]